MDDLEVVRLCATAMGLDKYGWQTTGIGSPSKIPILTESGRIDYDPLTNDAQAMALVKRFCLDAVFCTLNAVKGLREATEGKDG